jgi:hypothetical protein
MFFLSFIKLVFSNSRTCRYVFLTVLFSSFPSLRINRCLAWVFNRFSWFVYSLVTTSINEETVNAVSQPKIKQESVPPLELLSFSCSKEHGYTTVAGEVKNTSAAKLTNIMAVGEFRTKDGSLVKSEDAILQYNPIMPGQTSPFTVMGTDNPLITNCGLKFKEMFGGQIDYIDKAKK